MAQSNREKMLIMVAPAVLIVIFYTWWFGVVGKTKTLLQTSREADKAETAAPTPDHFREPEAQRARLMRELEKYQKEQAIARQTWDALAAACASSEMRNDRIEKLTTLLALHHLALVDDRESDASSIGRGPKALEPLGQLLTEKSKSLAPQLRQLQFKGNYVDVHALLQDLSRGEIVAVPVTLTMKPVTDGTPKLEWTLLVWI
jgi:hypothetical protein